MPIAPTHPATPNGEAYPPALFIAGDLTPEILTLVREAATRGARLTIVTVHPPPTSARERESASPPFTAEQLATHYAVQPATIRAWCREGRFSGAERMGRSWRIPHAAVRDRRPPATEPSVAPARITEAMGSEHVTARAEPATKPNASALPTADAGTRRRTVEPNAQRSSRLADHGFDPTTLSDWRHTR